MRVAIVNDRPYAKPPPSMVLGGGAGNCLQGLAFNVAAFIE